MSRVAMMWSPQESSEVALHRATRRIYRSRIVEALRHPYFRQRKRRGLIDGNDRRSRCGTRLLAAPNRSGREAERRRVVQFTVGHQLLRTAGAAGVLVTGSKMARSALGSAKNAS